MPSYEHELRVATTAVEHAGAAIMASFTTAAVRRKPDGSLVTDADLASDGIIRGIIGSAYPSDAILSEEAPDDGRRLRSSRCWVVDPLDGTAQFVRRTQDFDVYVALVVDGRPVIAAALQPATGLLLTALAGAGSRIRRRTAPAEALSFRSPGDAPRLGTRRWLGAPANLPLLERAAKAIGSHATAQFPEQSLGSRSFIPPDHPVDAMVGVAVDGAQIDAWEWDLAAVDLIVREAGGCSSDLTGHPLRFNQPDPRLKELVLSTHPETHRQILAAFASIGDLR